MKKLIIFFIILTTISFGKITGKVIKVYDGDTITILTLKNKKLKIRLYGIDAPEIGQNFGNKSKDFLKSILYKKNVELEIKNIDKYNRKVAKVFYNKKDVNLIMLETGNAWYYDFFAPNEIKYKVAEKNAQKEKKGLWIFKENISPYKYRKNIKSIR